MTVAFYLQILVDLNQVMISNLMVQIGGKKDVEIDENIFRLRHFEPRKKCSLTQHKNMVLV